MALSQAGALRHPGLWSALRLGCECSLIKRPRLAGILTKPDLVDRGTEGKVVDVAQNLVCHLKKGYMIVKCRGQQDIQDQVSLAEALQKEKDFFEDHPHFRYPGCVFLWVNPNLGPLFCLGTKEIFGVYV